MQRRLLSDRVAIRSAASLPTFLLDLDFQSPPNDHVPGEIAKQALGSRDVQRDLARDLILPPRTKAGDMVSLDRHGLDSRKPRTRRLGSRQRLL